MADQQLSLEQWHQRYLQQSTWTGAVRSHLFGKINLSSADSILEVGSGTGAVLSQLADSGEFQLIGVDIARPALNFSQKHIQDYQLVQADGFHLPFANDTFAISYCHYLLLWLSNPINVLAEMRRVTRSGGSLITLAEPDHDARIDYPPPLDDLGRYQTRSLQSQGADTAVGRKLRGLLRQTGLQKIETGILSASWSDSLAKKVDPTEWAMIRSDLSDKLSESELSYYEAVDHQAYTSGNRVLYIPTFYGVGTVP